MIVLVKISRAMSFSGSGSSEQLTNVAVLQLVESIPHLAKHCRKSFICLAGPTRKEKADEVAVRRGVCVCVCEDLSSKAMVLKRILTAPDARDFFDFSRNWNSYDSSLFFSCVK